MSGNAHAFRDTLAKPVISVAMKEMMTGAGHILPYYNKSASAAIEGGLARKEGNTLKFKLKRSGGKAGRGYNLMLNSVTGKEHVEITTEGHLNYGISFTPRETTYETTCRELKAEAANDAGQAFAREAVDNYINELAYGTNYVPFNPGNTGASFTSILALMRRQGATGKPNIITSTNMWEHMHNQEHTNTQNNLLSVNKGKFNWIDDVNSIPTYKTGDRNDLCLKVYGSCQTGCKIYICGGAAAAGRRLIRKGEVLEICATKSIDMMTHRSQGYNRQFVSQMDVWADSKGIAAVSIEPELLPLHEDYSVQNILGQTATSGGRKNVDRSPLDGATVIVSQGLQPNAEYEQSIVWFNDAMVKVKAPLDLDCGDTSSVSVRNNIAGDLGRAYFSKGSNIQNARTFYRWDLSLDYINLFPQYVLRLVGIKVADC